MKPQPMYIKVPGETFGKQSRHKKWKECQNQKQFFLSNLSNTKLKTNPEKAALVGMEVMSVNVWSGKFVARQQTANDELQFETFFSLFVGSKKWIFLVASLGPLHRSDGKMAWNLSASHSSSRLTLHASHFGTTTACIACARANLNNFCESFRKWEKGFCQSDKKAALDDGSSFFLRASNSTAVCGWTRGSEKGSCLALKIQLRVEIERVSRRPDEPGRNLSRRI